MSDMSPYVPLRISTLRPNQVLGFDLYIYFKETYLKYASRDESLDAEKLEKLKAQQLARFFITQEDMEHFQATTGRELQSIVANPSIAPHEKLAFTEGAAQSALEGANPTHTEQGYGFAKTAAISLRQVIAKNPQMLKAIFGKKSKETDLMISHSLNVCALATKLAELMGHTEDELDDLACAALIHDIGLVKLKTSERGLFLKDASELAPSEKITYYAHCKDSVLLLRDKPYINKRVQDLVINHEENLQGSGPNRSRNLTPLMEILSMVNLFDKILIVGGIGILDAYQQFQINQIGNYSLPLIKKFKEVLIREGMHE
jgi:HD-GYP domain-containing protein (c-di-GMP phosphodiesterase class II)